MRDLPHDPYIKAIVDTLTAAGLEPDYCWTSDAESNPYDGDGLDVMLNAAIVWTSDSPAVDTDRHPDGIALLWDHPADQWQWAERGAHGVLTAEPVFLPCLGRYAHPDSVTACVRALLGGQPVPEHPAVDSHRADQVRAAVAQWVAASTGGTA
ncbi:hypothetical protein [Streptomyces sp. PR69]|uniref:hypothetical protein n=1 Tax=Streptomyces sp. PR69 TaxID=2984950 RepID=UPI002264EDE4|nr:hypothetical protein [Streptomyces sp. PR69]